jgi:hypothetical protein
MDVLELDHVDNALIVLLILLFGGGDERTHDARADDFHGLLLNRDHSI